MGQVRASRSWAHTAPFAVAVFGVMMIASKAIADHARSGDVIIDAATGAAYLVAGAIVARSSDSRRMANLLLLAAVAWFAEDFGGWPVPFRLLGTIDGDGFDAVLAWLVLAFPTGRLPGRGARVVVCGAFFASLGLASIRQVVVWSGAHTAGDQIRGVQDVLEVLLAVGVIATLVRSRQAVRVLQRSTILRRAAIATAVVVAGTAALEELARLHRVMSPGPLADVIDAILVLHTSTDAVTRVAMLAVPVGVVAGVMSVVALRMRIAELGLRHPEPEAFANGLRALLRDPALRLDLGDEPTPPGCASDPILARDGRPLGLLVYDEALAAEPDVLDTVRVAAASSLEAHSPSARPAASHLGRFELLSDRQRQVLDLVADGHSNATIASRLGISTKGVEEHLRNIYKVLDLPPHLRANRRVGATILYLEAQNRPGETPVGAQSP